VEHRGHVGSEGIQLVVDAAGAVDHHLALLGEGPGGPVHQRGAQLALEPGDVRRHVGLDGVEPPGGRGERAGIGHRGEGGELAKVHHSQ
jgi:hypothetical protein